MDLWFGKIWVWRVETCVVSTTKTSVVSTAKTSSDMTSVISMNKTTTRARLRCASVVVDEIEMTDVLFDDVWAADTTDVWGG